ncbi:MAG: alpha/beta hydrolase family protein [Planctomycetota bacterium]|jgi:dienelactone hydrolase
MTTPDDTFTLEGADKQVIRGDVYLPAGVSEPPLVIVVHGFKGFKNWGMFPWMGRELANNGLAAACIDLSHNGVADDFNTFERLDLFEQDTWSKRVFDVTAVLDAATDGQLTSKANPNPSRIGLLGHSMGGGLALLMAVRDMRVGSICTFASVNRANRIPMEEANEHLKVRGYVTIMNGRTNQEMRIGRAFFDELKLHPQAFDVGAAAKIVSQPWLIVHGGDDETVPLSEAQSLLDSANAGPQNGENVKMLTIDGTGHTFGAGHPFTSPQPELQQAVAAATRHFLNSL